MIFRLFEEIEAQQPWDDFDGSTPKGLENFVEALNKNEDFIKSYLNSKSYIGFLCDYIGKELCNGKMAPKSLIDISKGALGNTVDQEIKDSKNFNNLKDNKILQYLFRLADRGINFSNSNVLNNIKTIVRRNVIDDDPLLHSWYYDEGLLKNDDRWFKYVINVADVLGDESKLRKYFRDTKNKGLKDLFDENGHIKEPEDIYEMIDNWTDKESTTWTDKGSTTRQKKKITLRTALEEMFPEKNLRGGELSGYKDAILELLNKSSDNLVKDRKKILQGYFDTLNAKELGAELSKKVDGTKAENIDKYFIELSS